MEGQQLRLLLSLAPSSGAEYRTRGKSSRTVTTVVAFLCVSNPLPAYQVLHTIAYNARSRDTKHIGGTKSCGDSTMAAAVDDIRCNSRYWVLLGDIG